MEYAYQADPTNTLLNERFHQAKQALSSTLAPSLLSIELATNPFLRLEDTTLQKQLRTDNEPDTLTARAPGAKLARLAIDRRQQRKGYGQILMVEAMKKTLLVAEHIGVIGFFVDAKNHDSRVYYEQFGFISFPKQPMEMFLPLATLRQAITV